MKRFTYLSLGAGVQSTALLVMTAKGLRGCPRASHAIFADTGDEPQWVYDHLAWCRSFAGNHDIELRVVRKAHLSERMKAASRGEATRFGTIPAFTPDPDGGREGMLRRQCTREYKIEPIEKEVRRLLGLEPRQRALGRVQATGLIGISMDEVIRMRPSRTRWITNEHPLIDARMTRQDCFDLLEQHGAPRPQKSSCVFCPYHSDAFWRELQLHHPEEFAKAAEVDELIRTLTTAGVSRPAFLHRSCKPLKDVDFEHWRDVPGQMTLEGFGNECDGMCGV